MVCEVQNVIYLLVVLLVRGFVEFVFTGLEFSLFLIEMSCISILVLQKNVALHTSEYLWCVANEGALGLYPSLLHAVCLHGFRLCVMGNTYN